MTGTTCQECCKTGLSTARQSPLKTRPYLKANLKLVVCGRPESLVLFVEPLGDEIGVEVCEPMLNFHALTVVAEHVAAKLNTPEGRAALKLAAEGSKQKLRWLPQVRVRLGNS